MSTTTKREYREAFAERVRYARTEARYTQKQIADKLGIGQPTYSKYEGRLNEPATIMPTYLLKNFCLICRVSLDWLIGEEGPTRPDRLGDPLL